VATVDLNRLKQGKKIKDGIFDVEFCFDSVREVEVGFIVALCSISPILALLTSEFILRIKRRRRSGKRW